MARRLFVGVVLLLLLTNGVALAQDSLPPLKAVLLVGPIDGDYGSWTEEEKVNMDLAAEELSANGVEVHKFYAPDSDWEQIKAAADGAHFLMYRGHGIYWSGFPSPTVGGFCLTDNFVSSNTIRQDLHLAPNALVMLYGCFAAGHSSASEDAYDIGITEASRRVAQYSDPFFDIGAAGYYSDWFGDAFAVYTRFLFEGQTLGEAYESYFDFNASTVHRTTHPDHPEMAMWLDKDYWSGYWQYNNAFVGLPDRTLVDLFGTLPGDLNADGFVGSGDLDLVRANWGLAVSAGSSGDADGDGIVNSADLDIVRANWGDGNGGGTGTGGVRIWSGGRCLEFSEAGTQVGVGFVVVGEVAAVDVRPLKAVASAMARRVRKVSSSGENGISKRAERSLGVTVVVVCLAGLFVSVIYASNDGVYRLCFGGFGVTDDS